MTGAFNGVDLAALIVLGIIVVGLVLQGAINLDERERWMSRQELRKATWDKVKALGEFHG